MRKIKISGVNTTVKTIDPITLSDRDDDEIVIVNRIRLNNKLVEFEVKAISSSSANIIRNAIKTMKKREISTRQIALGAEMTVADVKKVFPEYKSLPQNSIYENFAKNAIVLSR